MLWQFTFSDLQLFSMMVHPTAVHMNAHQSDVLT